MLLNVASEPVSAAKANVGVNKNDGSKINGFKSTLHESLDFTLRIRTDFVLYPSFNVATLINVTPPRIFYLKNGQNRNNQFRGKDVGSVYFAIGLGIGAVAGLIINVLAT